MANDALIEEGNTKWWLEILDIRERRRRDTDIEDERAEPEQENE